MKMKEIWKDINGYEGNYQISNFGKVRNAKGRLLKNGINRGGYPYVILYVNGKGKNFRVHRLVASAFLEINNFDTIDHINGNKLDNRASNLEFVHTSENTLRGFRKADKPRGAFWNKQKSKWQAKIQLNQKNQHLGFFNSEQLALQAYYNKYLEIYGVEPWQV